MVSALITVGSELLTGRVRDENGPHIAKGLLRTDLLLNEIRVTGDRPGDMARAIEELAPRCDVLFVTGGLGPTEDDLTCEVILECLGAEGEPHVPTMEKIRKYFALRNIEPPGGVWKMARVPRGARVFPNDIGMACGFAAKLGTSVIIAMPGVPREMQRMFDDGVLPYLRKEIGIKDRTALLFRTAIIREGEVDEKIMASGLPLGEMEWGICSGAGVNDISFSELPGKPFDAPAIGRAMKEMFAESLLVGASLEEDVVSLLTERGMTIALAESCTGGLIAARITDVPGASKVFPGSVVAYSNEAKVKLLGVSASTLERCGAVSEETAREMAAGARQAFGADIGVSVTGIAGPDGGSAEKPAGTVCFGFAWPGETVSGRECFPGDRERVRLFSTAYALNRVRVRLVSGL